MQKFCVFCHSILRHTLHNVIKKLQGKRITSLFKVRSKNIQTNTIALFVFSHKNKSYFIEGISLFSKSDTDKNRQ